MTDIQINKITQSLWSKKMLFLKVWGITFILSCLWILPQPRYYTTKVSVSPETFDAKGGGSIASLASNFGISMGSSSSDAIYPQLYPDVFKSTEFCVGLLDITLQTGEDSLTIDYYTYLKEHQKQNPLTLPFRLLTNWIIQLTTEKDTATIAGKGGKRFDTFHLSKKTMDIILLVQDKITCTYSKATDIVTISVTDQDALTSALLADSVRQHLQTFITEYRTKKAKTDYEHYKRLTEEAKAAYDESRQQYASYCDANQDAYLESVKAEIDNLENDMQLKFSIYSSMSTRMESAMEKVLERTPAFTVLTNATVPVKPAGPKRMIFVTIMLFLATCGTIAHLYKKELKEWF